MSRGRGRRWKFPKSWQGRRASDPRRQAAEARAVKQGLVKEVRDDRPKPSAA